MIAPSPILFVDRVGTLIEEPPDEQVDALEKIRFMPDVFEAMRQAKAAGFRLAMVTNQDGLGTASFPKADFEGAHQFMLDAFSSQGIEFDAVFLCPHFPKDSCECRKPKTRLVEDYVRDRGMDAARGARTIGGVLAAPARRHLSMYVARADIVG